MRKIEIAFSHKLLDLHVGKIVYFVFLTSKKVGVLKHP